VRVGVVGPLGPERFAENVCDALRRMGHQVIRLGPGRPDSRCHKLTEVRSFCRRLLPSIDERPQFHIARAALENGCETVINVDLRLMPEVVSRLKRAGVRVAFWFPDHVANLDRQLMLASPYDALFFKEPCLVERLKNLLGLPVYYLPEACNPRWHRPLGPAGTEPYLVVAGNMYPYRLRAIKQLAAKGIPLQLYGPKPPRWIDDPDLRYEHTGRYVSGNEKARLFRSAAGVLSTMHPAEIAGVNGRLFQAAGCGAAVLTEHRPSLPELFTLGHEVLAYNDLDELVQQAERLLSEHGLTARLGDAAARRAHADHTHDLRVATILEKMS
jgi:spore maturation protein CgeB